jgi:phospholipase C
MMRGRSLLVLSFLALWSVSALTGVAQADTSIENVPTETPIKHFVTLMQSNRSFDSYFGLYPEADGIPAGACMPVDPTDPTNDECVAPFHLENNGTDLSPSFSTFENQFRSGDMNGFVYAYRLRGEDGAVVMGHYDDRDLPFYWNVADEYVLFDRFFTSANGGSIPNRMFWMTGRPGITRPGREVVPAAGWGNLPTIFDRLEERGVSWKVYVQNYDAAAAAKNGSETPSSVQDKWAPILGFPRFMDDPALSRNIVDLDQFFLDVESGELPAVSYVVSIGASEHPSNSLMTGQRLVKRMLNGLMQSSLWSSTAFLVTYDDWGGWYDHVPPPQVDEFGYGFRTPALLVSPYARRGYVDSTVLDFTSILKFIEENFYLQPLAERDAQASSLITAFDFTQPPREPRIIPMTRGEVVVRQPKRPVIYAFYTAALVIPAIIIGGALGWPMIQGRLATSSRRRAGHATRQTGAP